MNKELQEKVNRSYIKNSKEYLEKRIEIIVNDILYCIEQAKEKGHCHLGYSFNFDKEWELSEDEIEKICNTIVNMLYEGGYDCHLYDSEYIRIDFEERKPNEYYTMFM